MAKTAEAQCGYCRKRFRLRPDQMNREVRCPHCKTVVRIHPRTEAAAEAVRALKAEGGPPHRPVASRQPGAMSQAAVRSRSLAMVWAILLAVALGAVIVGLVVVFRDYDRPSGAGGADAEAGAAGTATAGDTAVGPDGMPTAVSAGQTWQAPEGPITADIKRLLRGYKGETVTYAVGHVTNNTEEIIPTILIEVGLWLSEDGDKVGDAEAIILNLPPKHTAPIVAECKHDPGVRAKSWLLQTYDTSPVGVPRDLPPLEARNPVPVGDPNTGEAGGLVRTMVTNHGKVPVKDVLVMALLLDEKGEIVGAAKQRDTKKIEPDATEEVEIEWRHTVGRLVRNVEVWVQPHFYQAE
jgi:DNA-directed RNA polymerase subunit RPC12/RpoP